MDFFENEKTELSLQIKIMKSAFYTSSSNENLVFASYEVSKLIAETGYPHTICEKLIFPALKIITTRVYGRKQENHLSSLCLSNNTVKRRIDDMVKNIEETLIHRTQNRQFFFSLQMDESTGIADSANLMFFSS
jgi:hypothetical protein